MEKKAKDQSRGADVFLLKKAFSASTKRESEQKGSQIKRKEVGNMLETQC